MKNKMLFLNVLIVFCAINLFVNSYSMSFDSWINQDGEFSSIVFNSTMNAKHVAILNHYLNQDYVDENLQVQKCITLIQAGDVKGFIKYFNENKVNVNLVLNSESEDMNEKINEEEDKKDEESQEKSKGKTLLMVAVENKCMPIVEFLISRGANLNIVNGNATKWKNFNALSIAVLQNNLNMVKLLISKGATVDFNNNQLDKEFVDQGYIFGARLLGLYLHNYPKPNLELIKTLINNGYNLDERDDFEIFYIFPGEDGDCGNFIYYILRKNYDLEILKFLFDHLGNIEDQLFVIFNAIEKTQNIEIIKYLVESGKLDVNHSLEESFISCAIDLENIELIKFLIQKGADLSFINYNKSRSVLIEAIDDARKKDKKELLEILENWPKIILEGIQENTSLILDVSAMVTEYVTGQKVKKEHYSFAQSLKESTNKKSDSKMRAFIEILKN